MGVLGLVEHHLLLTTAIPWFVLRENGLPLLDAGLDDCFVMRSCFESTIMVVLQAAIYKERSPIEALDKFDKPVAFFQVHAAAVLLPRSTALDRLPERQAVGMNGSLIEAVCSLYCKPSKRDAPAAGRLPNRGGKCTSQSLRINAVLAWQGDEDQVVPPNQAVIMHEALAERGLPTGLVMFKGEQHGFRAAPNIRAALDGELYFYGKVRATRC